VSTSQVAGHQSLGLCREELRPGRSGPARRRVDAVTLQDRPDARGGDGDAHGGELAVDAAVAPLWILLRQPEHQRGGSLRDARPTGPTVRVGTVPDDEVPVPTQQGCRLDEEVPESPAGKQSCESRQHRSICRLQRRSVDLAPEDRHLVAQHDDLNGEIHVTATDEADQPQHLAERPVEEREGHRRMLAAPGTSRQSAARDTRMGLSARTRVV